MSRRAASLSAIAFAGWASSAFGQTPAVTLGPPVAAKPGPVIRGQSPDDGVHYSQWVAGTVEPSGDTVPPIVPLRVPSSTVTVSASAPDFTPTPPPPADSPFLPEPPAPAPKPTTTARQHKSYFGDMFEGWGGGGPEGKCLESDHCFDYFASPVSNPFYFEDPRSLTEIRPIFLFQTIPHHDSPYYHGGNAEFYGTQARIAITDQWSFVLNKLGGVSINPGRDSLVPSESGLAEIWLGPKWTFLRSTETGTVLAAGATLEIPAGPARVAQDTGNLSITPYITGAQNFGCTTYGSFNAMATLGYAIRADNQRTEYLFTSWHLDFDVGNQHRLYPLVELNWFHYTRSGNERPYNFEGADLANFGSRNVAGTNDLSLAFGARYKFTESIQTGLALEFPLVNRHDLNSFRLGMDLIFRY
ncbi:MAG TPA: hypothetical protein VH120_12730 [Gemmataceae bacterium]|jgi:hypothetical protein|nr:hypothetical protein [Gemmataceae bacterium]